MERGGIGFLSWKNKKGFEFSFAWMFALIVGAIILFLAIYASTEIIRGSSYQRDTEIAKELTILFDPFETGFAASKVDTITLPTLTRVFNDCSSKGIFGSQIISSSQQNFGKWSDPGGDIKVNNRYVFSREVEEGKKLYFFSKNFEMPFKAAELIVMTSKKYCFKDLPNNIADALKHLNLENFEFSICYPESTSVCRYPGTCDVQIEDLCAAGVDCDEPYDYGYVLRKGDARRMYYRGNLIYAAMFSTPNLYECNVKRLSQRAAQLSRLYKDQNSFSRGCGTIIEAPLIQLAGNAESLTSSTGLSALWDDAQTVRDIHDTLNDDCRIWVK